MLTPPPPICHRTVVGPARRARLPQRTPAGISRPTIAMGDFRPSLRELQRLFWRSLADAPGGGSPAPGLVELIAPRATLDAGARVGVYADAYCGRLRDVLREDFPHVAALLGPRFEETARGYLRAHPSEHPSVRHLGRMFADFLEHRPDLPPYLGDLARLEWARIEVFDAPDARSLNAAALRGVAAEDWPALRFVTVPALAVVRARWPVHELWAGADPAAVRLCRCPGPSSPPLDHRTPTRLPYGRRGGPSRSRRAASGPHRPRHRAWPSGGGVRRRAAQALRLRRASWLRPCPPERGPTPNPLSLSSNILDGAPSTSFGLSFAHSYLQRAAC